MLLPLSERVDPEEILSTSGLPTGYPAECSQKIGEAREIIRRIRVEREHFESPDLRSAIDAMFSRCSSADRLAGFICCCIGQEYHFLFEGYR